MDLNTRTLRYFVAVAELLHFTRAAEQLHVSQQALSARIRELEEAVGAQLFVRDSRNVRLTDAGEEFLRRATAALSELDDGVRGAQRSHSEVSGRLSFGFLVTSALELSSPILSAFQERHPQVKIELRQYQWNDPSCGLLSDETSAAFIRPPISCPHLFMEHLFTEPRCVGVAMHHRLAERDEVRLADLADEEIMAPRTSDPAWTRFWTLRDVESNHLPHVNRDALTMDEELETVAAGYALSLTPMSMVRYMPRPGVVFRPVVDIPGTTVALAWKGAGTPLTRALRAVTTEVRDQERELISRIEAATGDPLKF